VAITYDQTNTVNGAQYLNIYKEWYSALGQGFSANGTVTGARRYRRTRSKFRGVDLFATSAVPT
jgi:hypothetical protein